MVSKLLLAVSILLSNTAHAQLRATSILGVSPGMSIAEVRNVLAREFPDGKTKDVMFASEPGLPGGGIAIIEYAKWQSKFANERMTTTLRDEMVVFFTRMDQKVVTVRRRVTPEAGISMTDFNKDLSAKYGPPTRDAGDSFYWVFDQAGKPIPGMGLPQLNCQTVLTSACSTGTGPAYSTCGTQFYVLYSQTQKAGDKVSPSALLCVSDGARYYKDAVTTNDSRKSAANAEQQKREDAARKAQPKL